MLGFDAVGRHALGQLPKNSWNGVLFQAAGIGAAGSVQSLVAHGITQASGAGAAQAILANPNQLVIGVSGAGNAGSFASAGSLITSEAAGTGTAGSGAVGQIGITPSGVQGVGIAGQIAVLVSGGGTSRKPNSGLEPVKKRPPRPIEPFKAKVVRPLPLEIAALLEPRETSPIDGVEYAGDSVEARIRAAEDATDVDRMHRHLEMRDADMRRRQDDNDIADLMADEDDIADVMAMLELTD